MPSTMSLTIDSIQEGKSADYPDADQAGYGKNYAWVIDGATGLTDRSVTDAKSDAVWYSNHLHNHLNDLTNSARNLNDLLKQAVRRTAHDYQNLNPPADMKLYEQPSAACAAVEIDGSTLKYKIFADASIVIKEGKNITEFTDETIVRMDTNVAEYIAKLQKDENMSFDEARNDERVVSRLRENRKKFNTKDGYRVLSFNPSIVDRAMSGTYKIVRPVDLLIGTDGLMRAQHKLKIFQDWLPLFNYIEENGLNKLWKLVRKAERNDPQCKKYPRLSVHQETTALYVKNIMPGTVFE